VKGWMMTSIFDNWVKHLDNKMRRINRSIILLCDNAASHQLKSDTILTHVTLHFLPPNTTTHLQPCDAGIIYSFKANYRQLLCRNRITAFEDTVALGLEASEMASFTIFDAIQLTAQAWNNVTTTTIQHAWKKTGILSKENHTINNETEFVEQETILQSLIDSYPLEIVDLSANQFNAAEFINIDNNEAFREVPTVAQIIEELNKEETIESEE